MASYVDPIKGPAPKPASPLPDKLASEPPPGTMPIPVVPNPGIPVVPPQPKPEPKPVPPPLPGYPYSPVPGVSIHNIEQPLLPRPPAHPGLEEPIRLWPMHDQRQAMQGTAAGVGNPNDVGPLSMATAASTTPAASATPAGYTPPVAYAPPNPSATPAGWAPPVAYTPPSQAEIPVTGIPPGYPGGIPGGQPDSIKLYDPSYIDPYTGQVSDNLLGGGEGGAYADPNAIPPEELQRRWQLRTAGYTGEWGVGPEEAELSYGYSYRNLTSDYTVPGNVSKIRPDLLGGQYADQATIPETELQYRLQLRDAGYNETWDPQLIDRFLAGTLGSDATPPTTGTAGFRDLGKNYLEPDGSTIWYKLLGGQYADPATIPENVLRDRLRFRNAGYQGAWGSGGTNNWLTNSEEGTTIPGQAAWDAANGDPGDVISYGGVEGGVAVPPSGPVTLGEGKPTQRTEGLYATRYSGFNATTYLAANSDVQDAVTAGTIPSALAHYIEFGVAEGRTGSGVTNTPDVYLPTTQEREYTTQEHSAGTPEFHRRIRTAFGYTGDFGEGGFTAFFKEYVAANPEAQDIMDTLTLEYQAGIYSPGYGDTIADKAGDRFQNPSLPEGAIVQVSAIPEADDQIIDRDASQVYGDLSVPTAQAVTALSEGITATDATQVSTALGQAGVAEAAGNIQAAQGQVSSQSIMEAQLQTKSAVSNLQAQQGTGIVLNSAINRDIQAGELISEVSNAEKARVFTEQVQAATATPSSQATVQGQLATLTKNFDAADPPPWASGAIRAANEAMARRGLGSSSMAGQAILQATLESALPIAQADARTVAQFEVQNLSNRQQRAMLAAEQRASFLGMDFSQNFQIRVQNSARIGDIANTNFTADQQIQLENSKIANTVNLQNLTNRQAITIAEAAALANLDQSNLGNRQQSAVKNATSFLQQDMENLSNVQQVSVLQGQQIVQSLFTDQAARNASEQFNATSQHQVDQFFASLEQQSRQTNAAQINAQSQYNAGQANTVSRFNSEIADQRDRYNASNRLVIDQNNATWRRSVATADTAAVNRANEINAGALLDVSNSAYNDLFALYSDQLDNAFKAGENVYDRIMQIAVAEMTRDGNYKLGEAKIDANWASVVGTGLVKIISGLPWGPTK